MAAPIVLTEDNFAREVLEADQPVLVDFSAEWCGPCRALEPVIKELAQEYEGRVKVGKLDSDAEPGVVARYSIRGLPTLLFFKEGEVAESLVGAVPKPQLVQKLEAVLN